MVGRVGRFVNFLWMAGDEFCVRGAGSDAGQEVMEPRAIGKTEIKATTRTNRSEGSEVFDHGWQGMGRDFFNRSERRQRSGETKRRMGRAGERIVKYGDTILRPTQS